MFYRFLLLFSFFIVLFSSLPAQAALGSCPDCGPCHHRAALPSCFRRQALGCGCCEAVTLWASGEYLLLWRKDRYLPPLVTTSPVGTPLVSAGILGLDTTSVVVGDTKIKQSPYSGGRASLGVWFGPDKWFGIGMTYFGMGTEIARFNPTSNSSGLPILARPFNSTGMGASATPISYPLFAGAVVATGNVDVESSNAISGADIYFARRLSEYDYYSLDLLVGYTYNRIIDRLTVRSTTNFLGTIYEIHDNFKAINTFQGGIIGLSVIYYPFDLFTLQFAGKMGIGAMKRNLDIYGDTSVNTGTSVTFYEGGLLALPSNIGSSFIYNFGIFPQADVRISYFMCPSVEWTFGYTVYYWNKVALSGDAVDLNVNLTQTFGGTLVGASQPTRIIPNTIYWMQGLSAGLTLHF